MKRPSPHGFMLLELIGYMAILAIIAVLVSELFVFLRNITVETTQRDALIIRVDSAVDALRRDTWSATQIRTAPDNFRIVGLTTPQGEITWQISDDGILTRTVK